MSNWWVVVQHNSEMDGRGHDIDGDRYGPFDTTEDAWAFVVAHDDLFEMAPWARKDPPTLDRPWQWQAKGNNFSYLDIRQHKYAATLDALIERKAIVRWLREEFGPADSPDEPAALVIADLIEKEAHLR